ncbi:SRPBCC domain-containing protein [Nocardioides dilutus]
MSARPAASASIDAPLDLVWAVMLDTSSYGEWNPFVYRIDCETLPAVGVRVVLHVRWANGRSTRSPERITDLEGPLHEDGVATAKLSYAYEGLPDKLGLVHSIRHQWLRQEGDGPTVYTTEQELTGPMARFAGPARIADGFRRHAEGLRARAQDLNPPSTRG